MLSHPGGANHAVLHIANNLGKQYILLQKWLLSCYTALPLAHAEEVSHHNSNKYQCYPLTDTSLVTLDALTCNHTSVSETDNRYR